MPDQPAIAAIVRASRVFAVEDVRRTWHEVLPTLALVALTQVILCLPLPLWLRLPLVPVFALLLVRIFAFYHDVLHGAIFRRSRLGRALVTVFGLYFIYSPSIWSARHNAHHRHNSKTDAREVDGQIPMLTLECWRTLPEAKRRLYRRFRHPATVLCGYLMYFIVPSWISLRRDPQRHRDGVVWLLAQPLIVLALALAFDPRTALLGFLLPVFLAAAVGSYLFYAQHSFEGVRYQARADWNYHYAAFHTSSMFDMPRWMHWFCGNIGYHHIHHVNTRIPFYRLPEAMAAVSGLQNPPRTNWSPRALRFVFSHHVWDEGAGQLIGYAEAEVREPSGFHGA
ncbi:MAG TPA: fatty acid desaturase [Rhodanobacteraceae bacterium]|nr:fatty acid desaturase [Rhodanobacteraceae bacterium]